MRAENSSFTTVVRRRRWWGRLIVLSLLFLAWTGVGVEEGVFALIAGAAASTVSFGSKSSGGNRFRLSAFLRFLPYFFSISFRGGVDVARRAVSPAMPIAPGFVEYRLRVDPKAKSAVFFVSVISLVPGTLFVDLEGELALVHIIDRTSDILEELDRLERRVAPIFGESIP